VTVTYADASALVKLIVHEPETAALRRFLASAGTLTSSLLAMVEVPRAVARRAPEARQVMEAVLGALSVVTFDARIAARAASLAPASLRSIDAIHLATALELGDDLTAFVSYDDRLSAAAVALGLPVVAPAGDAAAAG
jgi:predicted nucleic acid-binding protein